MIKYTVCNVMCPVHKYDIDQEEITRRRDVMDIRF